MPNTVHKMLMHGAQLTADATPPMGKLGDEAREAMNEVYRYRWSTHSQKIGCIATNDDTLHLRPQ